MMKAALESSRSVGNSQGRNTRFSTGSQANKRFHQGNGGKTGKENKSPQSFVEANPMHVNSGPSGKSDLQHIHRAASSASTNVERHTTGTARLDATTVDVFGFNPSQQMQQSSSTHTVNMYGDGDHSLRPENRSASMDEEYAPHQSAMHQHRLGMTHAQPDSIESINEIGNALKRQTCVQNHLNHTATKFNLDSVEQALSSIPIEGASELPQLTDDPVVHGFYKELVNKEPNEIYNFLIDTLRFADGREVTSTGNVTSSVSLQGMTSPTPVTQIATCYHIEYSNTPDSEKRILLAHGLFQKDALEGFTLLSKVRNHLEQSGDTALVQELDNVVESLRPITVLYKIEIDSAQNKTFRTAIEKAIRENNHQDLIKIRDTIRRKSSYLIKSPLFNIEDENHEKLVNNLKIFKEYLKHIITNRVFLNRKATTPLQDFCAKNTSVEVDKYLTSIKGTQIIPVGTLYSVAKSRSEKELIESIKQIDKGLLREEERLYFKDFFLAQGMPNHSALMANNATQRRQIIEKHYNEQKSELGAHQKTSCVQAEQVEENQKKIDQHKKRLKQHL